jgi:hypothetical protein
MFGPAAAPAAGGASAGFALFVRAARHRLLLGADPVADAPLAAPPAARGGPHRAARARPARIAAGRHARRRRPCRTPPRRAHHARHGRRPHPHAPRPAGRPRPRRRGQPRAPARIRPDGQPRHTKVCPPPAARFGLETTIVRTADGLPGPAMFVIAEQVPNGAG